MATIDIVGKDIFTNMHLFIRDSLEINNSGGTPDSAAQIVAPAFVEEIGKLLFLYLTYITINHLRTRERIENIGTSLGAIGIVALGFATAENIQYLFQI